MLLFALVSGASAPASAAPARDYSAFLEFAQAQLSAEGVPGAAFAIVADGRIAVAQGYGVRGLADPVPVDPDTVFRIASVSKPLAAQLTAVLAEEGAVSWDDPVAQLMPELVIGDARHASAVRLRHLLGHTAGVPAHAYDNLIEEGMTLEAIIPRLRELRPACTPGRCYAYQNVLFALVQPYLERRTGRTYEGLMRTRVFEPLGMLRSSLGREAYLAEPNRARPHTWRPDRDWAEAQVKPTYYRIAPAAGVNSSANDLARFLLAQLGERPGVVTPAMLATLHEPRVRTPHELRRVGWRDLLTDAHYALGWRVLRAGDETIHFHSGWVSGFLVEISYSVRHRTGLVILLNGDASAIGNLSARFWAEEFRVGDGAQTTTAR